MTLITPSQRSINAQSQSLRFGIGTASPAKRGSSVGQFLKDLHSNRATGMIIEDIFGFVIFRTLLDLYRQYFFQKTEDNQPKLNLPAAKERLYREFASIFTDNFMGGILAYTIGAGVTRLGTRNIANQFISHETLELFQKVVGNGQKIRSRSDFIRNLCSHLFGQEAKSAEVAAMMNKVIYPQSKADLTKKAMEIADKLGLKTMDIPGKPYTLNGIMDDASLFIKQMGKKKSNWAQSGWGVEAKSVLANTMRLNKWRIPISIGAAMALTFAVPYVIRAMTRKEYGIDSYPGEMGLRQLKKVDKQSQEKKTWLQNAFPYLSESLQNGNPTPLLLSLVPLPFAAGLINSTNLSNGVWNKVVNLPGKGFLDRLTKMFQFGKGFPFTTQQQMASCFAFLIASRLLTSRSDIEFRERMVDSFLGWSVWILATPMLKRMFAQWWDKANKTQLTKTVGKQVMLRTETEIAMLPKAIRSATSRIFTRMNWVTLGITVAMLGIVEPLIGIKWTEWQAKRAKKNQAPQMEASRQSQPQVDLAVLLKQLQARQKLQASLAGNRFAPAGSTVQNQAYRWN